MTIGFTGTRSGMSKNQAKEIIEFFQLHDNIDIVHHGVCIGADADFHNIVRNIAPHINIMGHPGRSKHAIDGHRPERANVFPDVSLKEKEYLERNREIVKSCDMLLACPYNLNGQGGTWYTINYARKIGKPYKIFQR